MAGPSHTTSCFLAFLPPLARLGIRGASPLPPRTVLHPLGMRAGSAEGSRGQEGPQCLPGVFMWHPQPHRATLTHPYLAPASPPAVTLNPSTRDLLGTASQTLMLMLFEVRPAY